MIKVIGLCLGVLSISSISLFVACAFILSGMISKEDRKIAQKVTKNYDKMVK